MPKIPYYFWFPDDYLSSPWVEAATLEQEAIYRRLLDYQWKHPGCQLPDNPQYLRRLCKNAKWGKIAGVLEANFERQEGAKGVFFWKNPRIFIEFSKFLTLSEKNRIKANLRWNKEKPNAGAMPVDMPKPCLQNQNQNQNHIKDINTGQEEKALLEKKSNLKSNPKTFQKPTLEEITQYCIERKNKVNPSQFLDHYSSNGWKVGKNSMRDWKAAIRTWERSSFDQNRRSFFDRDVEQREQAKQGARAILGVFRGSPRLAVDVHTGETDRQGAGAISGEVVPISEEEASKT